MNSDKLEQYWQACRDGTATEEERQALDAYLQSDAQARAQWQHESECLALLERRIDPAAAADGERFTQAVLERWTTPPRQWLRLRPAHWLAPLAAAAAVIVAVAYFQGVGEPSVPPTPEQMEQAVPLTVVVEGVQGHVDAVPEGMRRFRTRLQTLAQPDFLVRRLGLDWPDPTWLTERSVESLSNRQAERPTFRLLSEALVRPPLPMVDPRDLPWRQGDHADDTSAHPASLDLEEQP